MKINVDYLKKFVAFDLESGALKELLYWPGDGGVPGG
jgi:hypothetical protein